ncbi:uncharacterized protein LOC111325262 [Stylophora pistillata]|uniref:uncharacterized protein LOC111325262 n=1 Tax=Stylophora pistillata TaxID=50429 RepID=UPI000C04A902|nr:uncharacterized protein LOC111325262 [Stylophora pistillata]
MKYLLSIGRFAFFALMVLQCFFLAQYPAYYEDNGDWYTASIFYIPAAAIWWFINSNNGELSQVLLFWVVYVWLGIVPMVGIVFGRISGKIESGGFWNASTLIMTLCITPFLLLLTLHTRIASSQPIVHANRVCEWTAKVTINAFGGIELLGVLLEEGQYNQEISKDFKNAIITFTCLSFMWWPLGTLLDRDAEKVGFDFIRERDRTLYLLSCGIQVLLDLIFFGLRLGLFQGYGRSVSVFMSKNIIFVIVYSRRIFSCFCRLDDDSNSTADEQHGERRGPSTSTQVHVGANSSNPFPLSSFPNDSEEGSAPPPYTANEQQGQTIESSTFISPVAREYMGPRIINVLGFNPIEDRVPSAPPPPYEA